MNIKNVFYVSFFAITASTSQLFPLDNLYDQAENFVALCKKNPLQTQNCINILNKLDKNNEPEMVIGLNYALEKKDSVLVEAILNKIKQIHDTRALWDYFSPAPDITNRLILRALENNLTAVLSMILKQNNPLHTQNMLKKAIELHNQKCLQYITLQHASLFEDIVFEGGTTIFHHIALPTIFDVIVNHAKHIINIPDQNGQTPLFKALAQGNFVIAEKLASHKAEWKKDVDGKTPLDYLAGKITLEDLKNESLAYKCAKKLISEHCALHKTTQVSDPLLALLVAETLESNDTQTLEVLLKNHSFEKPNLFGTIAIAKSLDKLAALVDQNIEPTALKKLLVLYPTIVSFIEKQKINASDTNNDLVTRLTNLIATINKQHSPNTQTITTLTEEPISYPVVTESDTQIQEHVTITCTAPINQKSNKTNSIMLYLTNKAQEEHKHNASTKLIEEINKWINK